MLKHDARFMGLAIAKAREGMALGQSPFGACIVRGEEVIACTHNAVLATHDATAHAEVRAIREASAVLGTFDLSGCAMFTTCEPCPMCFTASHWARLDRIIYGAMIADAEAAGFRELTISAEEMKIRGGSPVGLTPNVLRAACVALFHDWAAGQTPIAY